MVLFPSGDLLMRIRNQHLLKRPWLFPVYTLIGGAIGLLSVTSGLSVAMRGAIFVVCISLMNVWFFIALRLTRRNATRAEGEPSKLFS